MKYLKFICLILLGIFILAGCYADYKTADELIDYAKLHYGDFTLVSKNESEDKGTELILHDNTQDFDYKVYSVIEDVKIDTSKAGTVARIIDTFRAEYIKLVISRAKEKLDGLCINGQKYEVYKDGSCVKTNADTLEDAREFAQDVVDILRAQRIDRRIKDFRVSVYCGEEYLGKYEFPGWFFEEALK